MDSLSDNIEKVRELGISYGLSDRAIDECLLRAVIDCGKKRVDLAPQKKPSGKCKTCCKIVTFSFMLLLAVFLLGSYHKPTGMFLGKHLANISYPLFRGVRIATLPLAQNLDLSGFHDVPCLVPNPLFMEPAIDCDPCKDINDVKVVTQEEVIKKRESYLGLPQPILITDGFEETICFDQLKQMYLDNLEKFQEGKQQLYCTMESITDADILFKNYTESKLNSLPAFHAEWYPSKVKQAQVIRKLFKRPTFVPLESEIAIEKSIFIDGPKSKPYSVVRGHYPHIYYLQATGSRRMMLVPSRNCFEECRTLNVLLEARQILYFHETFWTLETIPVMGKATPNEISIGSMASFS